MNHVRQIATKYGLSLGEVAFQLDRLKKYELSEAEEYRIGAIAAHFK